MILSLCLFGWLMFGLACGQCWITHRIDRATMLRAEQYRVAWRAFRFDVNQIMWDCSPDDAVGMARAYNRSLKIMRSSQDELDRIDEELDLEQAGETLPTEARQLDRW